MATFIKHYAFVEDLAEARHNLATDTLKLVLSNVAPVAANSVKADLTEIAASGGYPAGGFTVSQVSSLQANGTYRLKIADLTITAVGGSIGPYRYATLLNATPAAGLLIGSWDYGSPLTLAADESTVIDFDDVNGVLQLT